MSHTDKPGGATPPASIRNPVRKRDAILDAMQRYHRAVGAVVAATAALCLNGALLSGFDTVARRGSMADVAAQKAKPEVGDAQQAAAQKNEVRMIELPAVQIVGRRLPTDVQMANQESPTSVAAGATSGKLAGATTAAPDSAALAPLIADVTTRPQNADQGVTASRAGQLSNALVEQKPLVPTWASTQP